MNNHIDFHLDEDIELEPDFGGDSADPFSDELPQGDCFLEESRRLCLNKLLHLAPYCELLLVTGEPGVGKSVILNQFVRQAQSGWRAGRLEAGSLMTARDLLLQSAQALGIRLDVDPHDKDAIFHGITAFIGALGRSGRRAILIVESAHTLAPDLLQALEALLNESGGALAIIFSTNTEYAAFLDKCPSLAARIAYKMTVEGLDRAGVEGYIRHRLDKAGQGAQAALFDVAVFDRIYNESAGIPRQINIGARQVLHGQKGAPVIGPAPQRSEYHEAVEELLAAAEPRQGGRAKWIGGGAAVLVLAAAALYWQDEINSLFELPVEVPVDQVEQSPKKNGGDIRRLELVEQTLTPEVTVKPLDLAPQVAPRQTEPSPVEESQVENRSLDDPEQMAEVIPEAAPVVEAPVEQPKQVVVEKSAPAAPAPEKAAKPADDPVPMAPSPVVVGESWLRNQSGDRYTMQLMALHDEAKVRRLVKSFGLAGEHAIYRAKRNGDTLYVVVYGSYPDKELALEASRRVPKSWGVGRPWVRQVGEVRSDIGMAR